MKIRLGTLRSIVREESSRVPPRRKVRVMNEAQLRSVIREAIAGSVEEAVEAAANAAEAEREVKDHSGIWGYDKPVFGALESFEPEDPQAKRQFYVDVEKLARQKDSESRGASPGRWTKYQIVAAVVPSLIASLTRGFGAARHSKLYGN